MEIRRESFDSETSVALARALEAELLMTYDGVPGSGGLPEPSVFAPPDGVFLVGRVDGVPVACGGIGRYDDTTAEVRRVRRPTRSGAGGSPAGYRARSKPTL
jgi:hypothetical protein